MSARPLTISTLRQVNTARCWTKGPANQGATAAAASADHNSQRNGAGRAEPHSSEITVMAYASPRPSKPLGRTTSITITMAKISMSAVLLSNIRLP
ncbi:hypothetical protein D9M68_767470 [compost metagenome]